jgi:ABC-type Zn uptake system ZnuABC Zn-binding protein ZnuA
VAQVPAERRKLVTDHTVFTYFAARYGFTQVGAIVPNYSTAAASSAQEMAALETAIQQQNVPAIFVGNTVNPSMAERVAQDTGTRLVPILTGSLTAQNGKGPTYIDFMKYNVTQIIQGLTNAVSNAVSNGYTKTNKLNECRLECFAKRINE